MVKVSKVAAYDVGGSIFTDRGSAEKAVRRLVLLEMLEKHMSFAGVVTAEDVADALGENWEEIKRKRDEAFRGIS